MARWAAETVNSRSPATATMPLIERARMCGPFVADEIVTDLCWTTVLNRADDIMTWANPGPGAVRGLNRIHGHPLKAHRREERLVEEMQELLAESRKRGRLGRHMKPLEMRDVEHSLCEFDKYMRVHNGEGVSRSKYRQPAAA